MGDGSQNQHIPDSDLLIHNTFFMGSNDHYGPLTDDVFTVNILLL